MKPFRWIYLLTMAVCLIAGLYTGLKVFHIIFLTQLLALFVVFAISLWSMYTFCFKQQLSVKTCEKGEDVTLHLEIVNEKPFPLSLLDIQIEKVSYRESARLMLSLAPRSSRAFRVPITTPYRGRYLVGMTKINITDIFGLISFPFDMRWLSFYRQQELIVLPRAQLPGTVSSDIVDAKLFSDAYLKQAEQGDSISGVRLYHDCDSLRRVHWKKSMQLGELYVKQYEFPERERILIMVDTALHGLCGEDALIYADTVCECAASIALLSLSHCRPVTLANSSGFLNPVCCASISELNMLRRHLAVLPFEPEADLLGALRTTTRQGESSATLFVITRGMDAPAVQRLEHTLSSCPSATLVAVGGTRPGGRIRTLYVESGSSAAENLQSLF